MIHAEIPGSGIRNSMQLLDVYCNTFPWNYNTLPSLLDAPSDDFLGSGKAELDTVS